tara:strand:+ start:14263 stop:15621 length:1359 start_codon:yes stop_codon:yes gene_type:complete
MSDFSIIEAVLVASKSTGNDVEIDLRASLIEFTSYEHLQKPWVDARVVIVDDFGLKDSLSIQGTERFRIVFGSETDPALPVFTKFFFVSRVNDTKKINERGELVSLDLVEDHVYINSMKCISRSYSTTIDDMITQICRNELGRGVTRQYFEGIAQGTRKFIVPYLSPLEAVAWVLARATTRTGGPVFLHGSLFTNDLLLSDFDSLMREEVVNPKFPLRYTSAKLSIADKDTELVDYYDIKEYREQNQEDTLALYEQGSIGSYYANIDAGTGLIAGDHVSIRDVIDEFYTNNLIDPKSAQTVYDPTLEIGGKLSDEYNAVQIFQVTSSGMYNQFQSYHDEAVLLDDNDNLIESKLKVKNKIIRSMLKKNVIDIGMSGKLFVEGKITVGNRVRLIFLASKITDSKDVLDQIDKRKSGDYLIMAVSHKFSIPNEEHLATLRLTKIGEIPSNVTLS